MRDKETENEKPLFRILELLLVIILSGLTVWLVWEHKAESQRLEWWFQKNTSGFPPDAAWSVDFLRRYDAYYLGDTKEKVIYLAFDEGYENGYTPQILDILKENNVPAAFFVTRSFLERSPENAVRMVEEGHVVCNHTVRHLDMTELSRKEFEQELRECAQAFQAVTGREMDPFFRPPSGVYSLRTLKWAQKMGYKTIFWSLAYKDWLPEDQPTAQEVYNSILPYCHNGCITLLHAVSSANAETLDGVIKALKAEGYEFKSLYDLP